MSALFDRREAPRPRKRTQHVPPPRRFHQASQTSGCPYREREGFDAIFLRKIFQLHTADVDLPRDSPQVERELVGASRSTGAISHERQAGWAILQSNRES